MKLRYLTGITLLVTIILICTGLYFKSTYKDYNLEEHPLWNFNVGLMTEELLSMTLEDAESTLDDANVILAVTCQDTSTFRFSCTTQQVSVAKVFKGDAIKEGDCIEIVKAGSHIFTDDDQYIDGRPNINMDFVNEMQVGKTYLVFLDYELIDRTGAATGIYITPEDILFAPIFCYDESFSQPYDSIDELSNSIDYKSVEESEFFLMSQSAVDAMYDFKNIMLEKYTLN